jgi:putative oxidoreductase
MRSLVLLVRRVLSGFGTLFSVLAPLLTRLVFGLTFLQTGLGKLQNFDRTVEFFQSLSIPFAAANAAFVGAIELVGGGALILGLGTRIFSLLLASTMIVALLTADATSFVSALTGSGDQGLLDVTPVPFLLALAWLAGFGAGPVSVDRAIGARLEPESRTASGRAASAARARP